MIIGLYLRHIKTYKGIYYIPIGDYRFVNYLGKNGSGKSSIIEAFDTFFNNYNEYSINKSAKKDGIHTKDNFPYFAPIFLIKKDDFKKNKKEMELLSDFFWNTNDNVIAPRNKPIASNFFKLRDKILKDGYTQDNYYLILLGETNNKNIYFPMFHKDKRFLNHIGYDSNNFEINNSDDEVDSVDQDEMINNFINEKFKGLIESIKKKYSYVYIPVEIDVENFTKIETNSMQKVFGKTLKEEIINCIEQSSIDKINAKLNDFVKEIEDKMNGQYYYDSINKTKKYLTSNDLFEKILEVYFKIRVLNKGNSESTKLSKKVSELSAGEKRQALIDLLYAFLVEKQERDKYVIVAIDEPENSLHTSLCFEQFEKLRAISQNCQVFITTHWYGFLPIIAEGIGHFLTKNDTEEKVEFESYELYGYKSSVKKDVENNKNKIPHDFQLKSMNDLVHSIFYSINKENHYNWLICEGISEKIYFECLFEEEIKNKNLRILPLGGQKEVIRLYKYLEIPIQYEAKELKGKVYCLIDTDNTRTSEIKNKGNNLIIKRLMNTKDGKGETALIDLSANETYATTIENVLNPFIFKKTLENLTSDEKYKISVDINSISNTEFYKNLRNADLEEFFKINDGKNKIIFAQEYVKVFKENYSDKYIPSWIKEIKKEFI